MSPRQVLAIAAMTIREATRRRVAIVLVLLAVLSVAAVGWGTDRLVSLARENEVDELRIRLGVSQVLILVAFMFSFVLALSAAFLAAPAIASDVETGTVLAVLARPLSRGDLVVGRWLGLCAVVVAYTVLSGSLAIAVVGFVSGHTPPEPWVAIAYLALEAVTALTLALALGTRLPAVAAGSIAVVLFGLSWFGGVLGSVATIMQADALATGSEVLRFVMPTDLVWKGVVFGLEPPLFVLLATGMDVRGLGANPFFAAEPPPFDHLAWSVGWIAVVLVAGIVAFRRREL